MLILDEPANGLDPAGIRWMRDLLREYADQGGTVLLSSHLLHEIEVIADDLVVIGNGRIVAAGHQAGAAGGGRHPRPAPRRARPGRARWPTPASAPRSPADGALRTDADPDAVGRVALAAGVALTELRSADGAGLEEMFLELTAETQRDDTIHEKEQQHDHPDRHHRRTASPRPAAGARRRRTPHPDRAGSSASSCARCSTPGRASG